MNRYFRLILFLMICGESFGQFTSITMPSGYTQQQIRFRNDIMIDDQDNIWLAFNSIGLGKYDGSWTIYDSLNTGFGSNRIIGVIQTSTGFIAAACSSGISVFNGATWNHFSHINSPLPNTGITCIEAAGSNIWVGTNNGIYIYDGNTSWSQLDGAALGLISDSITCLALYNGAVAIGTRNGLSAFGHHFGQSTNYVISTTDAAANYITDLAVTSTGEVWFQNKLRSLYFTNADTTYTDFESLVPQPDYDCGMQYEDYSYSIETYNGGIFIERGTIYSRSLLFVTENHRLTINTSTNSIPDNSIITIKGDKIAFIKAQGLPNVNVLYTGTVSDIETEPFTSYSYSKFSIDINNVYARVLNNGVMHWDPVGQTPYHTVPKCSYTNSVYCSGLWIGGYDSNNQLHVAAELYRQSGAVDFWTGPIDTVTRKADSAAAVLYNDSWKINKKTIEEFKNNYTVGNISNGSYEIPYVIAAWPANSTGNITRNLAPYYDNNADGFYNPADGDYPCISGDQHLWFIYNDVARPHTESLAPAFGIEVQGNVYAYDGSLYPDSEIIDYTTFYHYEITNRSDTAYHDVYMGLYVDGDLGNASDDYVQCNPNNDYGFIFNGDDNDEGADGYGLNPPIQNFAVLKGPVADAHDGRDNNHNGITDEAGETNMMSYFRWIGGNNWHEIPGKASEFMGYLTNKWIDDTLLTFGNLGHNPGSTQYTNFAFPGTEDPSFTGQNWTMFGSGMPPNDMRNSLSSGPFTLLPGETKTFDFAYIFTRDSSGGVYPDAAIAHNKAEVLKVKKFWSDHYPSACQRIFPPAEPEVTTPEIFFYPNPSSDEIGFTAPEADFNGAVFEIYNAIGQVCKSGILTVRKIKVSGLASQLYIVKIMNHENTYFGKFIKN